jgi:hypothetical protein
MVQNIDVISIGNGGTFSAAVWHDFWGRDMNAQNSHKSWRPLTIFTFQLNHWASGATSAAPYHATNAILHALVSALVVWVGRVLTADELMTSTLAGLVFALHPVHVEAVTGLVGRADELGTLFCVMAFLVYVRLLRACGVVRAGGANHAAAVNVDSICGYAMAFCCLFWAGCLCKEVSITVLGIVAAYDLAVQPW